MIDGLNPARAVSREFPIGIQTFTIPELAARWQCPERKIRELIESRRLRANGNRVPFATVRRWEREALKRQNGEGCAVKSPSRPKDAPNWRQCAAVNGPAMTQAPKKRTAPPAGRKPTRKEPRR